MSGAPETESALAAVIAAAPPSVREHARRRLPDDRFAGRFPPGSDRGFTLEAVHEGWLMHYGTPRAFVRMDDDLRLLGGDALYALGVARVAEAGDLEAVAELSDLITLTARAAAEGRHDWSERLWEATVERLSAPGADAGADRGAATAFAGLARSKSRERA